MVGGLHHMSYVPLVLGPLITGVQLEMRTWELNIVPAFPPSGSDVIHLLEQQCLLSTNGSTLTGHDKTIETLI
jgi:hypothetical protein